jgi:hypothetical protein
MLTLALMLALVPAQDTLRYTFESAQVQEIDAAGTGQSATQDINLAGEFRLVLRDTTGGRVARVLVDTVSYISTNPMMAQLPFAIPSGTTIDLHIEAGKVKGMVGQLEGGSLGTALLMGAVGQLFNPVADDAAVGTTWSDTTVTDSVTAMGQLTSRSVVDWVVASRDAGTITLTGNEVTSVSAEMENGSMSGQTRGTRELVLGGGEPARSLRSENAGEVQMLMGGMAITVKQTTRLSFTRSP